MDKMDFSNGTPVQILNIDVENGGNVFDLFRPYSNDKIREFTRSYVFPILPEGFFTRGGLTLDAYVERISTQADAAASEQKQFFRGVWQSKPDPDKKENNITVKLETKGNAVFGQISVSGKTGNSYPIEHIQLSGHDLKFTFRKENNVFVEVKASIEREKMKTTLYGDRRTLGSYLLLRKD